LISITKAEQILKSIIHSRTEVVPLDRAYRRILAEDVVAAIDVPSFDRADMDGYAVHAADTYTAREDAPVQLVIRGVVHAGYVPALSISAGVTAEIATGAMLPAGADAVVMVEYTEQAGDSTRSVSSSTPPESGESAESSVLIGRAVHAGENVMRAGADIKQGHRVLSRGTQLGSREIGVLAARCRQGRCMM
jgi:putative molybdopterin biosynthesis protein